MWSAIVHRQRGDQARLGMAHQMCHSQTAVSAQKTRVFRELSISPLLLGEHADARFCVCPCIAATRAGASPSGFAAQ